MAIKKRTITLTTGTSHAGGGAVSGEARGELGLGAKWGKILKVEVKGDDANVDTNNTFAITDNAGRIIFPATALDFGTDDGTVKSTEQGYSTVGLSIFPTATESQVYDQGGDAAANTEGPGPSLVAETPLLITLAAGTDGDVHRIHVFVEV